jgi:hypothetical protein
MSWCQIIEFNDGKRFRAAEYGNADGGAARIWEALLNKDVKDPARPMDSWMCGSVDETIGSLSRLAKSEDLQLFERAVQLATHDRAIIEHEDFARFAAHLRQFVAKYPAGDRLCHLSKWADYIEASDAEAIGFRHSSCAENHWYEYDEEEEMVFYDLNTGHDHFILYDQL